MSEPEPIGRAHEDPQLLGRIAQAASAADLGAHKSAHPALHPVHRKNIRWLAIATPVLALVTLVGVLVNGNWWFLTGLLALGFGLGLVGNVVTARPFYGKDRGVRLDLYTNGLVYAHGGGLHVVRYDRTSVTASITHHRRNGLTAYRYHLIDLTGTQFLMLGNLANPQSWGPVIQDAVVDAQLAPTWAALEAGQRVQFGDLWMTGAELGRLDKAIAWERIERVDIDNGAIAVTLAGKIWPGFTGAVGDIPNFRLFYTLAEHSIRLRGRDGVNQV
ncbi:MULTISPECIES: DUF6585 family protein [Nocardia]|uniref:DUF6585 family protein n=1 Tax=Nocardia TaxID=1817 RepID=UPI00055CDA69|nr:MULTISPECIES: DUF6585 family protein [Nocardia]